MMSKLSAFLILFFFSFSLSAEQAKTTLYQKYIGSYAKKGHKESDYFNQWITIPANENLLNNATPDKKLLKELIETESKKSSFIGRIKNKSFQIQSYHENDDAKYIIYEAEVFECYKGDCPKRIRYKVSMEVDDSFYPTGGKEEIIFLEKNENEYYHDPFLSFEATENTKSIFSRILKRSDVKKSNNSSDKIIHLLIETISHFYPNYDKQNNCWIVKSKESSGNHYCLSVTQSKVIDTQFGRRRYLVLTGTLLDENNEDFISHLTSGMAALFIVNDADSKLIAASSNLLLGSYSTPPAEWKLIKLAPSDYWGWQTWVGDTHQGYSGGSYLIYAPYGKQGIKDIATISAFYSNKETGVTGNKLTELDTKFSIVVDKSKRVYSLKARLSGIKEGKKIKERSWVLPFDTKSWRYVIPDNWPLIGYEY